MDAVNEKYSSMTDEEMDLLIFKYGLRFRTASQFNDMDDHLRKWIFRLMEHSFERGKSGDESRNQF